MTSELYLSESDTSGIRPRVHEPNSRNSFGISPYAVPDGVSCVKDLSGLIVEIEFLYAGGEKVHTEEPLDSLSSPAVTLGISHASRKIILMTFDPGVDANGLIQVSGRLMSKSGHVSPRAKVFSFRMIGQVLRRFASDIFSA